MTRRRARATAFTAALGLTLTLGLAALPAQAIPIGYGNAAFTITTHVQDLGNSPGLGSIGQGKRLEAIYVTQHAGVQFCINAHVAGIGWQGKRCTTGTGTTMMAGTVGQARAIEAVQLFVPQRDLYARAHLQNLGWQAPQHGRDYVEIGTTGRGIAMEGFDFKIY